MKQNKKRNLLAALLSATVVCSAFAVVGVTAKAEVTEKSLSQVSLTMKEGASVRLVGKAGIRFSALMSTADYASIDAYYDELSYGAFIVPAAYHKDYPITNSDNFFGANPVYDWDGDLDTGKKPAMATESLIYENDEGSMQINGSVVGIHDKHLYLNYVGVCYVKGVKDGGTPEYKFATLAEDQERNIVYVAQKAIESGKYTEYETQLNGFITDYIEYYQEQNNNEMPQVSYTVETYYNDTKVSKTETADLNEPITLKTEDTDQAGVTLDTKNSTLTGKALANDKLVLKRVYTVDMSTSITMSRGEDGILSATVTGADDGTLYVNDEAVSNPYTVPVSADSTFTYQLQRNLSALDTPFVSDSTTRFIPANALAEEEIAGGKYVIEDFSNGSALTNVSVKATQPLGYTDSMVDSVVSHQTETISTAHGKAEKSLKVETKGSHSELWFWSGAVYYFAGIDATKYERVGMKIVFPDWANSQWRANYIGLVIDGKLTPIDLAKYVYIFKTPIPSMGTSELLSTGSDVINSINALCAYLSVDLTAYVNDFPDTKNIEGIYFGGYAQQTAYIDEIYVGSAPDALDYDFSSKNDLDAQIEYVVGNNSVEVVKDEKANDGCALKITFPAATWTQINYNFNIESIVPSDYQSIIVRMRAEGDAHAYLKNADETIVNKQEFISKANGYQYVEWNILDGITDTDTKLKYLKLQNGSANAVLYIDSITFVKKTS